MESREGRIIIASMVLGAAAGGIAVMLLRWRATRRGQTELEPLSALLNNLSWGEVFGIATAGIALARRISSLSASTVESSSNQ